MYYPKQTSKLDLWTEICWILFIFQWADDFFDWYPHETYIMIWSRQGHEGGRWHLLYLRSFWRLFCCFFSLTCRTTIVFISQFFFLIAYISMNFWEFHLRTMVGCRWSCLLSFMIASGVYKSQNHRFLPTSFKYRKEWVQLLHSNVSHSFFKISSQLEVTP